MRSIDLLERFLERYEDNDRSPRTIKNAKDVLTPFINWLGEREITEEIVRAYLREKREYRFEVKGELRGYSDTSLYQIRSVIKAFINSYNPELAKTIKLKMKPRKPPQILSPEEVDRLFNACLTIRDKAMLTFLYESGCRKSELKSITLNDVCEDESGGVTVTLQGKTGIRTILVMFSASYIRQWVGVHPTREKKTSPLFCSLQAPYGSISFTGIEHQLEAIKIRAGFPEDRRVYCHLFRHSRATHLAKSFTEAQLKAYLGWSKSSDMAAVYVNLSQRDMEDAVRKMHGLPPRVGEHEGFKVGVCPRCKDVNPETALYCSKCGLPLKEEMRATVDRADAEGELLLMQIMENNPDLKKALTEELYKLTNNKN